MRFLKKVFVVMLMVLIPAGTILAQTEKGDKELSFAASISHTKINEEYNGYKSSDSFWSIRLAGRLGFFVTKNVEIEPEITICKIGQELFGEEDTKMGYILSCNLAYNFTSKKKTVPFVLAGFGISNSLPFYHNVVFWGLEDTTFKIINAGAGLKLFSSKNFAFRVEYRLQHYFGGGDESDGTTYTYHYGLVGISVFLK